MTAHESLIPVESTPGCCPRSGRKDVPARVLGLSGGADVVVERAEVNAVLDTMLDAVPAR